MALEWNIDEVVARMKIGDSFFVPTLNPQQVILAAQHAAAAAGISITYRRAMSEGVMGVRTWRIDPDVESRLDIDGLE